jgi:hypothetical protein
MSICNVFSEISYETRLESLPIAAAKLFSVEINYNWAYLETAFSFVL